MENKKGIKLEAIELIIGGMMQDQTDGKIEHIRETTTFFKSRSNME
ncbi:MAG: hypothetical protein H7A25_16700 [Leptospiraceae bacterium]|nr:hypothetical protein [Leptospiraceae bacterium]